MRACVRVCVCVFGAFERARGRRCADFVILYLAHAALKRARAHVCVRVRVRVRVCLCVRVRVRVRACVRVCVRAFVSPSDALAVPARHRVVEVRLRS